jgi:hypothetical protein
MDPTVVVVVVEEISWIGELFSSLRLSEPI